MAVSTVGLVAVGIAVGGKFVGSGVDVDSTTGTCGEVQAARRRNETMTKFFIDGIICRPWHCP
jgi:hypothetical protein